MHPELAQLLEWVMRHQIMFRNSIPLIASENITSPLARRLLCCDFGHRYAEGKPGKRFYQGCQYIDLVESKAIQLASKLFRAPHVNLQPVSGVNANMAAIFALTRPGDLALALPIQAGGHLTHSKASCVGIRGLRLEHIPFDQHEMNIDPDGLVNQIRKLNPKIVILGASLFLFPHPVAEAAQAAQEYDCYLMYDAAHVLGLIAGGYFQDPLREGAHVVTGSTHKTLPGPQRGIILCTSELGPRIDAAVYPGVTSNHHLNTLAALAITLLEFMEFGREYASQIISNSKALAQGLYERGIQVLCEHKGFTQSHQVVFQIKNASRIAALLERAGIIVNKNLLPWDDPRDPWNPSGIRLGTQEVTRLGMRESQMDHIAELIYQVAIRDKDPDQVSLEVRELRKDFQKVHYCFQPEEAYTLEIQIPST